jgi:tripartite-type tricarboxylate transporter receptor subunit TctC
MAETPFIEETSMTRETHPLRRRDVLGGALALAAAPALAQPSAFPSRPVRMLVGYAAGGGVDAMARMLATRLSPLLGQQVNVENRPGAASAIAADAVAKAPADGYTLLVGDTAMLVSPLLGTKVPYDPIQSFTPVAGAFQAPLMIVAHNGVPASTPAELVALMKANPGRYSYATSGIGTEHHLGFEILKARTGASAVHVPYRGASQILPDVMGGQIPLAVVSVAAGMAQARAGRLKAVAQLSTGKLPGAESLPVLAEVLPGFDVAPSVFVLAPAGTPAAVVERLGEAIRTVLASADLAQAAAQAGVVPAYLAPPAQGAAMARETAQWADVIRQQKITAE